MPSPLSVVSACLRGIVVAAPGHELMVADFEQIEARGIAWLAGQHDALDVFRSGRDVYKHAASGICGIPYADIDETWRQIGKVSTLALGYMGGVFAFVKMAKTYGLRIGDHFDAIWNNAETEHTDKASEGWLERGRGSGIEQRTWLAAEVVKLAWRAANPATVRFWRDLDDAAIQAVENPGLIVECGPVRYRKAGSFLWCQLPSGRCLCYPYPRLEDRKTPWGAMKKVIVHKHAKGKAWLERQLYGGLLAENVTQAICRDLMAEGIVRVEGGGYPVVLHVHDEIVCEIPVGFGDVDEFVSLMTAVPVWAKGFPVEAKGWRGGRYRKK